MRRSTPWTEPTSKKRNSCYNCATAVTTFRLDDTLGDAFAAISGVLAADMQDRYARTPRVARFVASGPAALPLLLQRLVTPAVRAGLLYDQLFRRARALFAACDPHSTGCVPRVHVSPPSAEVAMPMACARALDCAS